MTITKITNIDNKKHIALLDTSSISFMQGLDEKGIPSEDILKDQCFSSQNIVRQSPNRTLMLFSVEIAILQFLADLFRARIGWFQ